jgi:hypothetical protein
MLASSLWKVLFRLGAFTGIVYIVVGIVGGLWPGHWDGSSTGDQALWFVFLIGGGVLLLAGLRLFQRSPWSGAALVSLGAVAGALPIFWSVAAPLVAIALIVLSFMYVRRAAAAAANLRTS